MVLGKLKVLGHDTNLDFSRHGLLRVGIVWTFFSRLSVSPSLCEMA